MKRFSKVLIIYILFCLLVGSASASTQLNYTEVKGGVFNGNFELGSGSISSNGWIGSEAYGWYANVPSNTIISYDSSTSHSGTQSIHMAFSGATSGYAYTIPTPNTTGLSDLSKYAIKIKPSTKYKISTWIKTSNAAANSVFIDYRQFKSDATSILDARSTTIGGTNDWTLISFEFTSNSEAYYLLVGGWSQQTGISDAWFDDVTIEEVVDDTQTNAYTVRPIIQGVTSTDNIDVSKSGSNVGWQGWWAQQFTPTKSHLTQIQSDLYKLGSPTGTQILTVAIETDNGNNNPSGTIIASTQTTFDNLVSGTNTFYVPCILTPGQKYWATFKSDPSWTNGNGVNFYYTIAPQADYYTTSGGETPWVWGAGSNTSVLSLTTQYAKSTESASITVNGVNLNVSTNDATGLLSGAKVDLDKGFYNWSADLSTLPSAQAFVPSIYSATNGTTAGAIGTYMISNAFQWYPGYTSLVGYTYSPANTVIKVNTMLPAKSWTITTTAVSGPDTGLNCSYSYDGTSWTTLSIFPAMGSPALVTHTDSFSDTGEHSTIYFNFSAPSSAVRYAIQSTFFNATLNTSSVSGITQTIVPGSNTYLFSSNGKADSASLDPSLQMNVWLMGTQIFTPVVDFVGSPTSPIENTSVSFVDYSTGSPDIYSWNWSFGDGATSTQRNPSHIYSVVGKYNVSLTVSNGVTNTTTKVDYINVLPAVSDFIPNNTVGYYTPMPVTFTDNSSGAITWNYTFGDTYTSTLQSPSHIYTVANNYTVTQNVTNSTGSYATSSKYVELATDDSIWLKSWMQFNNATVTDLKGNAWTAFRGATTSATQSKFGGSSLYIPDGGAVIESPSSTIWNRAGQTAEMEYWIYIQSIGAAGKPIIHRSTGGAGTTNGWGFYNINATTNGYSFWWGNAAVNHTPGFNIQTGVWTHVVLVRNASQYWNVYKNGVLQSATLVGSGGYDTTNPMSIGAYDIATTETAFYLDEFRYTQGNPIFVSDFSTPYAQYNGNLHLSYVNINPNATLRYKTDPGALAYIYNQTGYRNRTVQVQNITNATTIDFGINFDPTHVFAGTPVVNTTNYADLVINSYSVDDVNGVVNIEVSRNAGMSALFENRTNLVNIPMLYYNYSATETNYSTFFTAANITDGQHGVTYPIYNYILTPIQFGMWGTPVVNFAASNTNPAYGETVTFAGSVTNYPNAFNWSFGDGTYSSLQNPTHAYYSNGVKTVSFRAYHSANESITNTTTKVDYITVGASPLPVPTFTSALTYASPPATIQFNVTNGGLYTTAWNWSFGDGTWSNVTTDLTKNVTHTYSYPGNYDVTLYETNNAGTGYKTSLDFVVITDPKFVLTPSPLPLNRGTVNTSHFAVNNISHAAGIATNISYNKSAVTIQSISLNSIGGTGLTLSSSYDNSAGTAKFGVAGSDLTYTTETNIIDIVWKANVNITNATAPVSFSAIDSQSFVTSTSGYPANRFVNAVSKTGGNIELRNDTVQKTLTFKNAYTKNLVSGIQVRLDWTGVYNGTDTTTTGSYTFLSSTFGSITVVIAADGYYNVTQTIAIDNADETVLMSPTSGAPSQVTWYTPQQIKLTAVDLFGKPLEGVEISATPLDFTAPDDWAQILIGVQPAVNMSGITLLGTTGIDGSWVAPMLPSYQYQIILTSTSLGVSHTVTLYPSDPSYVIYCPTTGQGTQKGVERMANLMNSTMYVTEPNSSYITWNLMYLDPSGYTIGLKWEVECWNNHTIMYSKTWGAVGVSDVITDSYTFPSVPKGMEYRAQYNATRDVP